MDYIDAVNSFTVLGRLPSLNDYINACRVNRYRGAQLKRDTEAMIRLSIRAARGRGKCWPVRYQCMVLFYWQERTHRRDLDNIFSSKKYILDAMVAEGIIKNDSQKSVGALTDRFTLGEDSVFVVIERM